MHPSDSRCPKWQAGVVTATSQERTHQGAVVAMQALPASRALLQCPAKQPVLTGAACHFGPPGSVVTCDQGTPCGTGALTCASGYEIYAGTSGNNGCRRESPASQSIIFDWRTRAPGLPAVPSTEL